MRPNGTHKHRLVWLGTFGTELPIYSPDGSEFVFYRSHLDSSGLNEIGRTLLADANGDNIRRPPCGGAISYPRSIDHYGATRAPLTFSPDGRSFLVWNRPDPQGLASYLISVSLGSCTGRRIVNGAYWYADWQAVPAP